MQDATVQLTPNQKRILSLWAAACHPPEQALKTIGTDQDKADLEYLRDSGLIDRMQNHISDRGAAYAVTQCDISFTGFMRLHKWQKRLGVFIAVAQRAGFDSDRMLDVYFREKYRLLIKYDSFTKGNSEDMPTNPTMLSAEMALALLSNPEVDWRKVKKLLSAFDQEGTFSGLKDKPSLQAILQSYVNEGLANAGFIAGVEDYHKKRLESNR